MLVHAARRLIKGQTKGQTFRSDPLLGVVLAHPSQEVVEAGARCMDVQQARPLRPGIRERVREAERRGDERARSEAHGLVSQQELRFALEDVERVDVVVVGVRIRSLEAGLELELDEADLIPRALDRRHACGSLEPLPTAGAEEDRICRRRSGARSGVDAVEAALLATVARAQVVRETRVGSGS